jgi:hypothetical protein
MEVIAGIMDSSVLRSLPGSNLSIGCLPGVCDHRANFCHLAEVGRFNQQFKVSLADEFLDLCCGPGWGVGWG